MWYYRLIAFLTALDLIGKSAVEALPEKAFPRELPPGKPLLLLKRFHNEGLPLGFLSKRREIVLGGPLLIESLVLFRFSALLPKRGRKYEKTALALVLAGGASNLFDRFFRGFVVDYLSLRNRKAEHVVFNLGDCFIALGMGLTAALELARGLKRLISKRRQA